MSLCLNVMGCSIVMGCSKVMGWLPASGSLGLCVLVGSSSYLKLERIKWNYRLALGSEVIEIWTEAFSRWIEIWTEAFSILICDTPTKWGFEDVVVQPLALQRVAVVRHIQPSTSTMDGSDFNPSKLYRIPKYYKMSFASIQRSCSAHAAQIHPFSLSDMAHPIIHSPRVWTG